MANPTCSMRTSANRPRATEFVCPARAPVLLSRARRLPWSAGRSSWAVIGGTREHPVSNSGRRTMTTAFGRRLVLMAATTIAVGLGTAPSLLRAEDVTLNVWSHEADED